MLFTFFFGLFNSNWDFPSFVRLSPFICAANIDIIASVIPFEVLLFGLLQFGFVENNQHPLISFLGFLISLLILGTIYEVGKKADPNYQSAFGFGDVLFGSLIGLYFGFPIALKIIATGLLLNGFMAIILIILKRRDKDQTLPLSPGFALMIIPFLHCGFV